MIHDKDVHYNEVHKIKDISIKLDNVAVPIALAEIRLFAIVRNESLRLPYFFKYYKAKGVDRFFIIDNGSTDGTIDIALAEPNVHLYSITEPYRFHWKWMEYFLSVYGENYWCLVVDIDELVYYPYGDSVSLRNLISYLNLYKYSAVRFLLLDMYSEKPINEVNYLSGEDPLQHCPYFDTDFEAKEISLFDYNNWEVFNAIVYLGGMRDRVFNINLPPKLKLYNRLPYHLSKVSLFKKTKNVYLTQGMHALNGGSQADIIGTVFHTKFMQDFVQEVSEEAKRGEHFGNAILYKIFEYNLKNSSSLILKNEESNKFTKWQELVKSGMMKNTKKFDRFVKNLLNGAT